MSIASLQFVAFIIITVVFYYLISAKYRWTILLLASVVFYVSFSVGGIFVLLATALLTWFAGIRVQKIKDAEKAWLNENKKLVDKETRKKKKEAFHRQQGKYVVLVVAISVAILFLCKYYGYVAKSINLAIGTNLWTAEKILLPLGISYYSLQLIGYIVDVSRDVIEAEKNPLKVILYGCFFLSIMQGPFNRYNDLMPQVCNANKTKLTSEQAKNALLRIIGGYIKKLCIADQVGIIASEVFSNYTNHTSMGILLGIICFAIQLYADFAGYMDIIIGIGELFGIRMPENFRQPFFARSIQEFWQRWHISLGAWLKDYVFYPVLKSKAFKSLGKVLSEKINKEFGRQVPTYIGMLILWTLIGIWHGAGLNYVFSVGILQFIYIFLGEVTQPIAVKVKNKLKIKEDGICYRIFQSVKVTILMLIAWVFFKSDTITKGVDTLKQLFISHGLSVQSIFEAGGGSVAGKSVLWLVYILICVAVLFWQDYEHEKNIRIREILAAKPYYVQVAFYFALAFTLIIFGAYGSQYVASNFIYFEF